MKKLSLLFAAPLLALACGAETDTLAPPPPPPPPNTEHPDVQVARQTLKTVLDLHSDVISRSCSPSGGVCHNGKEEPDLRTPGSLLSVLSKPCNTDRFDEPYMVFDGCEREADELVITMPAGEFRSRIAYLGPEEFDNEVFTSFRHLRIEDAVPVEANRLPAKIMRGNETLIQLPANILIDTNDREGRLTDIFNLPYQQTRVLQFVRSGDPNDNGVYGAEDEPWETIAPGHPDRSYLWARITGTVPGTRMPLANHPLSDPEYIAIRCWIETMNADPTINDAIDYDNCAFADHPISYQVYGD